jgi:hypothetical protein
MSRLLTICPYDLIPLRGGGALRSFHLLRQLARFHKVHAVIFQGERALWWGNEGNEVPDGVRIAVPWMGRFRFRVLQTFSLAWA